MGIIAAVVQWLVGPREQSRGYGRGDFLVAFIPLVTIFCVYTFSPLMPGAIV